MIALSTIVDDGRLSVVSVVHGAISSVTNELNAAPGRYMQ